VKIILYTDVFFEDWDWRNSIDTGIGGSETHQVEMAWRLARRGNEVTCYAPVPPESDGAVWRGVKWVRVEKADFTEAGTWVIYRNPLVLDRFGMPEERPHQKVWFMAQDEWYSDFNPERVSKLDRFIALCEAHARACVKHCPDLNDKMVISSNGVKMDLVREIMKKSVSRNPYRLMMASSPDRGLKNLLKIFRRAHEFVPDLELHAFYGFDNMDKLIAMDEVKFGRYKKVKEEIQHLMDHPKITWHGRVNQPQLYEEMLKTGIWCYPTNFRETSCIQCMEMQILGAVPITNPVWALAENVEYGIFVPGDAEGDKLVQARYAAEIVRLATHPEIQEAIRGPMMNKSRYRHNWERAVDQWEGWLYGLDILNVTQYNFQLKNAVGDVLNVGCDIDLPGLGKRGVNLDLNRVDSIIGGVPNKLNVQADGRLLPFGKSFDTVILGDILEHFDSDDEVVKMLREARGVLRENGRIVVTVPDDRRPHSEQHDTQKGMYASGINVYHHPVPRERVDLWLKNAGLGIDKYQTIDYTFAEGHGVVAS